MIAFVGGFDLPRHDTRRLFDSEERLKQTHLKQPWQKQARQLFARRSHRPVEWPVGLVAGLDLQRIVALVDGKIDLRVVGHAVGQHLLLVLVGGGRASKWISGEELWAENKGRKNGNE